MGLLLALMMVFSLCANSFTAYAWNLSDIEEMPIEDPNAIADEPVVDEPEPVEEDDYLIEEADEPTMTIEEDNQNEDLGDGLEISDEKVPEAVGAPGTFSLDSINTIAKDKDGNYYGVRTYGNTFDTTSFKTFYKITEEEYNQVSDDCFMVFKRQDGESFEIPYARIGDNSIDDPQPSGTTAGPIFTEVQFRHHMAYRLGFMVNSNPTTLEGLDDVIWSIELKKDWIIDITKGYGDENPFNIPAYVLYNCVIEGNNYKLYRADDKDSSKNILDVGWTNDENAKTHKITIKNLTIDGSNKYRCVTVLNNAELSLENVKVQNGTIDKNSTSYSGGVTLQKGSTFNMDAKSSITGCKSNFGGAIFINKAATANISGNLSNNQADLGGAICSLNEESNININGATFDGNKAVETIDGKYLYGGAVYSQSNLNVENSKFTNNSADDNGGAIYSSKAFEINKSEFNKNSSKKSGGAVYAPAKTDIKDTKFSENKAKWGGAIANFSDLSIKNATFEKNEATSTGGAIYTSKGIKVEDSSLVENKATKGGAVYISKGESEIKNTSFTKNESKNGGGAIFINHNSNVTTKVSNSIFTENTSNAFGGGIYLGKNGKLEVSESEFAKNQAVYGAGISSAADVSIDTNLSNIKVEGTSFTENEALEGGGIFTAFPTEISTSIFTKNIAHVHPQDDQKNPHFSGVGGAIRVMDNKTTIKGSTFEENVAFGSGGAIGINGLIRDNDGKITGIKQNIKVEISGGTRFIGNICNVGQGGAIYTIPYLYDIEDQESDVPEATLKANAYQNLSTADDTVFKDNVALSGFVDPPANYKDFNENLKFARNSFTDVLSKQTVAKSLLNNYDVNYKNDNLSAFFDPNGGEFKDGDNPKDIRVVNGEKGKEITLLGAPKWEGHKFRGWKCTRKIPEDILNKLPDEIVKKLSKNTIEALEKEGKVYQAGEKFKLDADYIFVAQWDKADTPAPKPTEPSTVILTLDENYRNGKITNIEVEEGDLIEPHLYIPSRRGYIFRGWSYDQKHLDEVKPGDRIYTDTTLYAIWKRAEIEREEEPIEIKGDDHKTYIFGYPDGSVRPNGSITRAEAAAMLARLLNIEAIGSAAKPQFTDTDSSWYNKAINAVVFRGIMKGYPDGRFRPNAPITRAEFTQMISTIDNKPYGVAPFADVPGHWAERAIGSEYQAKRITGYPDGLFRPDANITRAEAAVILNKIFERKYDAMSLAKCKNALMLKRFIDLDETFWGWNDLVEATNTHEYVRRYKEDVLKRIEEDWLLIKDINDIK